MNKKMIAYLLEKVKDASVLDQVYQALDMQYQIERQADIQKRWAFYSDHYPTMNRNRITKEGYEFQYQEYCKVADDFLREHGYFNITEVRYAFRSRALQLEVPECVYAIGLDSPVKFYTAYTFERKLVKTDLEKTLREKLDISDSRIRTVFLPTPGNH